MSQTYNESNIQVLEGIEAIRARPGMYVGGTDAKALHHLVWEVVNNSLDEHLAGYGDEIYVTLHKNGSLSCEDFGRGIPLGIHPKTGVSVLETVLTIPHAGGKFGGGGYAISGGLHGVGVTCVNALSTELIAVVRRDGKQVTHTYHRGVLVDVKEKATRGRTGTKITFHPDSKQEDPVHGILEADEFNAETIKSRLRQTAFLLPKFTIHFINEIDDTTEVFHHPNGLLDYAAYLRQGSTPLHDAWYISAEKDGVQADVLLQYTDSYATNIISFANLIATKEGGTHESGVKMAITRTLNSISLDKGWLKENLTGDEWLEGLTAIISVKLPEPQFEGQTKNKLSNTEIRAIMSQLVSEQLTGLLAKDASQVKAIAEKALLARRAKEASKKASELVQKGGKKNSYEHLVTGKYAPCSIKDPAQRELFLVEGESAGGSAKQGRDRKTQSIQMLKGKILNVEKKRIDQILENEEIRTLIVSLGTGIGEEFDIAKCNYHKIIIMTDADVDGSHIRILLLTFFFRYMLPLIKAGYIYVAQPPLYKVAKGKEVHYAWTEKDREALLKKYKGATLQRFKGLGEMNADQLWDTTMNPATRQLKQLTIEDVIECDRKFSQFMGEKAEQRREFLMGQM
ncbi:MAG: DNA gyrase/topoisomerase IV subunit B [Tumebacillaceae bacterium]